jgi:hypothetical protein
LSLPELITSGSWRCQVCQPYTPAAFTPQEIFLVPFPLTVLNRPQDHSAAGRIMSMKNSSDINGNRTRELPAFGAVPQRGQFIILHCKMGRAVA